MAATLNLSSSAGQQSTTASLNNAINDHLLYGQAQRLLAVTCGLAFMSDAIEVTMRSFLSAVLSRTWVLSSIQTSGMMSCVFAGMLLGSLFWGVLADSFGRRPTAIASSLSETRMAL